MPESPAPTVDEVERIVGLDDQPELRNLLITQTYFDLSRAMSELLGSENANWCTFGCWASRTAGRFIRKEEVPERFRGAIEASPSMNAHAEAINASLGAVHEDARITRDGGILTRVASSVIDDIALYITAGNKVVFADLGRLFAAFVEEFGGDTSPDQAKLDRFVERYSVGEVQPDEVIIDRATGDVKTVRRGGESLLREMIHRYHEALFESDADRKAEIILYANALGGLHEQTRLQTYIVGSMDAPIHDLLHVESHAAIREQVQDEGARSRAHAVLDSLIHPLTDELTKLWEDLSTKAMMVLKLPDGVVWLGRDIPARPGAPLFPPALAEIQVSELRSVLQRYDALETRSDSTSVLSRAFHAIGHRLGFLQPDLIGSAASDWSRLSERMRFIFELFRSRQQDENLLAAPFTADQQAEIKAGRIPQSPLY